MDMVRQMDMSYSYKPILLKAILLYSDDKGRIKLSDIDEYYKAFFENRKRNKLLLKSQIVSFANRDLPIRKM